MAQLRSLEPTPLVTDRFSITSSTYQLEAVVMDKALARTLSGKISLSSSDPDG